MAHKIPETLRYRVAEMNGLGIRWLDFAQGKDDIKMIEARKSFNRWVTEWIDMNI